MSGTITRDERRSALGDPLERIQLRLHSLAQEPCREGCAAESELGRMPRCAPCVARELTGVFGRAKEGER